MKCEEAIKVLEGRLASVFEQMPPNALSKIYKMKSSEGSENANAIGYARYIGKSLLTQNPQLIEDVLTQLDPPKACTFSDVVEHAVRHIALGHVDHNFQTGALRFGAELDCQARFLRSSQTFVLFRGVNISDSSLKDVLWEKNDFTLRYRRGEFSELNPDSWDYAPGCYEMLSEDGSMVLAFDGSAHGDHMRDIHLQASARCTARALESFVSAAMGIGEIVDRLYRLPFIVVTDIPGDERIAAFSECMDAYFEGPTKSKDSLKRRLANAIKLLWEAMQHRDNAVSLALSCSAIEAIMCSKKDGIADELSRNISTMLAHKGADRLTYIKYVKSLYDIRSQVLHGSHVTLKDSSGRDKAIRLAMAVLRAYLSWCQYARRISENKDSSPQDLFKEIEEAKVSGQRLVGIPDESEKWVADDL